MAEWEPWASGLLYGALSYAVQVSLDFKLAVAFTHGLGSSIPLSTLGLGLGLGTEVVPFHAIRGYFVMRKAPMVSKLNEGWFPPWS